MILCNFYSSLYPEGSNSDLRTCHKKIAIFITEQLFLQRILAARILAQNEKTNFKTDTEEYSSSMETSAGIQNCKRHSKIKSNSYERARKFLIENVVLNPLI